MSLRLPHFAFNTTCLLQEREERKKEIERQLKPTYWNQQGSPNQSPSKSSHLTLKGKMEDIEVEDPNSRQGTSPLLTSLLKSPSPAPNPNTSILNQMNLGPNPTRASAPTITNLLTGSLVSISTSLSAPIQKSSTSISTISSATIFPHPLQTQPLTGPPTSDTVVNNVVQSPSQSAPTLSMLLENKNRESTLKVPPLTRFEAQQMKADPANEADTPKPFSTDLIEGEAVGTESPIKDEDQQLMDVFNGLLPDDELNDILTQNNAIILNPDLLEEDAILDNVADLMDAEDGGHEVDPENKTLENQISSAEPNATTSFQNVLTKSDNAAESANQVQQQQQQSEQPQQIEEPEQPEQPHQLEEEKQPEHVVLEHQQASEQQKQEEKPNAEESAPVVEEAPVEEEQVCV